MTSADKPIFGPYKWAFDGDGPVEQPRKYFLVPPEDIEAMKNLMQEMAKLATDQDARIKKLKTEADALEKQCVEEVKTCNAQWQIARTLWNALNRFPDKDGKCSPEALRAAVDEWYSNVAAPAMTAPPQEDLTFNAFLAANKERQKDWPSEDWQLEKWMTCIAGEVGEAANIVKKIFRGDITLDDAREALGKEFADIQTYLTITADKAGIDLPAATIAKFNEVSDRIGSPVKIPAPQKGGAA